MNRICLLLPSYTTLNWSLYKDRLRLDFIIHFNMYRGMSHNFYYNYEKSDMC